MGKKGILRLRWKKTSNKAKFDVYQCLCWRVCVGFVCACAHCAGATQTSQPVRLRKLASESILKAHK